MMKGTKRHHTFVTSTSAWLLVACVLILCVFAASIGGQTVRTSAADYADRVFYMHEGRHAKKAPTEAEHHRALRSDDAHVATWSEGYPVSGTGAPFPGFSCQERSPLRQGR